MHTYIHTYAHAIKTCMHACIHTYMYRCMQAKRSKHHLLLKSVHRKFSPLITHSRHTYMHTYIHTYMHTGEEEQTSSPVEVSAQKVLSAKHSIKTPKPTDDLQSMQNVVEFSKYIHTRTHTYIHTYKYIHTHTHTHTTYPNPPMICRACRMWSNSVSTYIHTHTHTYTQAFTQDTQTHGRSAEYEECGRIQ